MCLFQQCDKLRVVLVGMLWLWLSLYSYTCTHILMYMRYIHTYIHIYYVIHTKGLDKLILSLPLQVSEILHTHHVDLILLFGNGWSRYVYACAFMVCFRWYGPHPPPYNGCVCVRMYADPTTVHPYSFSIYTLLYRICSHLCM